MHVFKKEQRIKKRCILFITGHIYDYVFMYVVERYALALRLYQSQSPHAPCEKFCTLRRNIYSNYSSFNSCIISQFSRTSCYFSTIFLSFLKKNKCDFTSTYTWILRLLRKEILLHCVLPLFLIYDQIILYHDKEANTKPSVIFSLVFTINMDNFHSSFLILQPNRVGEFKFVLSHIFKEGFYIFLCFYFLTIYHTFQRICSLV